MGSLLVNGRKWPTRERSPDPAGEVGKALLDVMPSRLEGCSKLSLGVGPPGWRYDVAGGARL